ncbi:hypothetical protein [Mucilaginibacter psychrotolerans]|uniref:Uncharacterized protein n=1 Tax=Mucilaginibacter psychrotolerans TaxID=1524096 RepID=A0A4Y8S4H9_9SPHI|nr:hypothetical protein [Mucilaginibacter psychrotolerans]TFF33636.1 hypothetical protein E2R66_25035 [Mucilaginibacter psychrotolerans]
MAEQVTYVEIKLNSRNRKADFDRLEQLLKAQQYHEATIERIRVQPPKDAKSLGMHDFYEVFKIVFKDFGVALADFKIIFDCFKFYFENKQKLGEYLHGRESIEVKVDEVAEKFDALDDAEKRKFLEKIKQATGDDQTGA